MSVGGNARIQLQLQNARQVMAGLAGVTGQIKGVAAATHSYNTQVTQAHHRTFLMNQALFTMRRFAYGATLALGALAAASVRSGLRFNISMEQNTIAMEHFLGSSGAATRELDYLYELAARTPFEFQQVVNAERRFLAFGFSVDEARNALTTIGDVAAGLGGDPAENIERLVLVLGQVRATGRVLGQDMLQLQQLGINTNQIFRDELGLTREQMKNGIGELQIPSEVAIPALLRGMQKQFDGMAEKQSKTLGGMLSTLHDYTAQMFGALTLPLFTRLRDSVVPGLIAMNKELSQAAKNSASWAEMVAIIDKHVGAHGVLARLWVILANVFMAAGNVLTHAVIPALAFLAIVLSPLLYPLELISKALLFMSQYSAILAPLIVYLTGAFIAYKTILVLSAIWTFRQDLAWKLAIISGMRFGGVIRMTTVLMFRGVAAMRAYAFATVLGRSSMGTFMRVYARNGALARGIRLVWAMVAATRVWVTSLWLVRTAIFGIPIIGWIAAIITALIILEMKFHFIQRAIEDIWGLLIRFKAWITGNKISWDDFLPSGNMPGWVRFIPGFGPALGTISTFRNLTGLASGGSVSQGGMFVVGERGPELAMLPRGTAVKANGGSTPLNEGGIDLILELRNIFEVDGEKLEEKLATHRLNKKARK